jgi:putative phosphoesterase
MRHVGVISDTHGLLRPQALAALQGSALIIHAGDVGNPEILAALGEIAPVFAVRGNVDRGSWSKALPEWQIVEFERHSIYVLHDLNELDLDPVAAGLHAVICGHSHRRSRRSMTWSISTPEARDRAASICRSPWDG